MHHKLHWHKGYAFSVNSVMHITILFLALIFLGMFLIVPAVTANINAQIQSRTSDALTGVFQNTSPTFKQTLKQTMPVLQTVRHIYRNPDEGTTEYNRALSVYSFEIVGALFICLLTLILVAKFMFRWPVGKPVAQLAFENFAAFAFIGIFEYLFFTYIISQYIALKPSAISTLTLHSLKTQFQKAPNI